MAESAGGTGSVPRIQWPAAASLEAEWNLPRVDVHEDIGSTQDRALDLALTGAPAWTTVLAHRQVEGRGRRGAAWESRAGLGLWMSIVWPSPATSLPALPLRVGLAVCTAVEKALSGEGQVQVKWPNDVLIAGRKVAGILAERRGEHTLVGIGVNLLHSRSDFGPELAPLATSMSLEGWRGAPKDFGRTLFKSLRQRWAEPAAEVLEALHLRDALAGRTIVTQDGREGRGGGFFPDGALRVCGEAEEWRVSGGSVRLLEPSAPPVRDGNSTE